MNKTLNKTLLSTAMGMALGMSAMNAHAVAVYATNTLTVTSGVYALDANGNPTDVTSGSWFGMDLTPAFSKIQTSEKTAMIGHSPGIVIGSTQTYGTLYPQTGPIDEWFFGGNQGQDYTTVAVTGSTAAGLNMSGWTVKWGASDGAAVFPPMGTGAWQPGNCGAIGCSGVFTNGNAHFQWDGTYGNTYTLQYTATVPAGDPSGFGGVQYYLYLTGTVTAVPVPAAVWMFGSGLLGLVGIARRKKKVSA